MHEYANNTAIVEGRQFWDHYWGVRSVAVCPDTAPEVFGYSASYYPAPTGSTGRMYLTYASMFGWGNRLASDWFHWNVTGSNGGPTPFTPNVNHTGSFAKYLGTKRHYVPEPSVQPMYQDAGRADTLEWGQYGVNHRIPANHLTLKSSNTVHMDGHVRTYRYDELEPIATEHSKFVNVPIGWLSRVGP